MTDLIADTARRLFATHVDEQLTATPTRCDDGATPWQDSLWHAVAEAGFPLALLTEEEGGFGLASSEALGLVRIAAEYVAPIPLGESLLANWLFAKAGMEVAQVPATLTLGLNVAACDRGWRVTGRALRVPFARHAKVIAALATDPTGKADLLLRVEGGYTVSESHNLAGETRDDLVFDLTLPDSAVTLSPVTPATLTALGAVIRAQSLAGALQATLEKCVAYVNDRVQFGRPLARFQAIQHNLAMMAGEVSAARAAADMAAAVLPLAITDPPSFALVAATAKLRTGEAAGIAAGIAHQVHGAIGFSHEYPLHLLTRRLWAWREEFGSETFWADCLGTRVCQLGADGLWPLLTAAGRSAQ